MMEGDEPIPILKPLRVLEIFLSLLCLVFFTLYTTLGDVELRHHLSGLLFATFIAFFMICLVDIISQVAGDPVPTTPMFLFAMCGMVMFLASGVIAIHFYDDKHKYSWAMLTCAIASLITAIVFAVDAVLLCREVKSEIEFEGRPLFQWPRCRRRRRRQQPVRAQYIQMPKDDTRPPTHQKKHEARKFSICPHNKKDEMVQTSGSNMQFAPSYAQLRDDVQRKQHVLPKFAFHFSHKQRDETVQTSGDDLQEQLLFATPIEAPAQLIIGDEDDDGVLVDDKRVLYRQVSQGQLLQIVNCINVRRIIGSQPAPQYGSDTMIPEKTSLIEAVARGDSVERTESISKDVCTQYPSRTGKEVKSKRSRCCCRGDSVSSSPGSSSIPPQLAAVASPNNRGHSPRNGSRNQEVQVDPYQLGMRVVPVQRKTASPGRRVTPVAVASRCQVDLIELPGCVPEK